MLAPIFLIYTRITMTNYRRNYIQGGTYFFTVVTNQRRPILTTELARNSLRQAFENVRRRRPFYLEAIVLLPDHLHCVWTLPPDDGDFSTRWRQIKTLFTKQWLLHGGSDTSQSRSREIKGEHGVWQRRFFEHTCQDDTDMKRCVDYLHANPVKHGLVAQVRDWPWSTFHRYVRLAEYSNDWGAADEWYGDEWRRFE